MQTSALQDGLAWKSPIVASVIEREIDCLLRFAGQLLGYYLKRN